MRANMYGINIKEKRKQQYQLLTGRLDMERNYGVHTMHQGTFQNNWVKPGGHPFSFYSRTQTNMQSSRDVLDKWELKEHKHKRESDLYEREVNIKNHAYTHKCSSYCLQTKTNVSKYNKALHANVDHQNIFEKSDGEKTVKSMTEECRLGFGEALKFDHSGERNITHGIKPSIQPYVQFDNNGMQKYMARRNHPHLIQ